MKDLIRKVKKDEIWLLIGTILLFCFVLLAWLCGAWLDLEIASQLFAAIAGAIIAAIITMLLLKGQSESEETKDKNIKIYEKKIEVYSDFISSMWGTLSDDRIDKTEYLEIRSKVFDKLIFYVSKDNYDNLIQEFKQISVENNDASLQAFCTITQILKSDLDNCNVNLDDKMKDLWISFGKEKEILEADESFSTSSNELSNQSINGRNCIFFNIYDWDIQIKTFKENVWELGLFEDGETWRTNQVKRVQKNDLVFLFQRGGAGFVGIFRVKGWRVFDKKDNKFRENVFNKEDNDRPNIDEKQIEEDIKKYDIYNAMVGGATSAANIMVEPLIFNYKGVGNPASVYRKTISSYDQRYAWLVCSRFLAIKDDDCTGKLEENTSPDDKKVYNTKLFEEICRKNNVVAASDTVNWYNESSK